MGESVAVSVQAEPLSLLFPTRTCCSRLSSTAKDLRESGRASFRLGHARSICPGGRAGRAAADRTRRNGERDRDGHAQRRRRRLERRRSRVPGRRGPDPQRFDVGIGFSDGSAFSLKENARIALNEFVYDPNSTSNSALINLVHVSFIAAQVAKTGNMRVDTPTCRPSALVGQNELIA